MDEYGLIACCARCEGAALAHKYPTDLVAQMSGRTFRVCPKCGDKRCPRAAWHGQECVNR